MTKSDTRQLDVLVTAADRRQGLAVIRALGSQGLSILAAGPEKRSLGFYSRYACATCWYPDPLETEREFIDTIRDAVTQYKLPYVFPVSEETVITLDKFRAEFDGLTKLALPPSDALAIALDKNKTMPMARSLGITTPQSMLPKSREEALSFAERVGFPIVMKPRVSYGRIGADFGFKVDYAQNSDELAARFMEFEEIGAYPLLQEYCPGLKVNHGVLCAGGELKGIYQYEGEREFPATGGITSLHLSTPVDPQLREWTRSLVREMRWDGVAMIEYKVDKANKRPVLMEVNGRFWSPQSAANKLGMNFPYALYCYLRDGYCASMDTKYPIGKRNRYLLGDITSLASIWLGTCPNYLSPVPGRWQALWYFLRDFRPGVQYDVLDFGDSIPSLRYLLSIPLSALRKLWKWFREQRGTGTTRPVGSSASVESPSESGRAAS
jgi:predicted ATP-grasp superfamily ATP-dependent carboligase